MKKRWLSMIMAAVMVGGMTAGLVGCTGAGSSSGKAGAAAGGAADDGGTAADGTGGGAGEGGAEGKVLRVGMECAYAPFNWTQETAEVKNGDTAVPIYGQNVYAYGYDVMMAKKLAEQLGWDLEIHKVEWDTIGLAMDSGEYDCIIAGMGKTPEREASYAFTEPYYYRDNCLTVKKGSGYEDITSLADLAGENVVVTTQTGTGWVSLEEQIPDLVAGANYATTAECFMAVSNGVADVALIDRPTAESAVMTNTDLVVVTFEEGKGFVDDNGMTNVCIATRLDDTALRDTIQEAMDALGWDDRTLMDEMMEEAISVQPAAN